MNRKRFMNELERLLLDIPYNERKEAIQYYNDYFDDAGPENEARVIEELGSPEQVARTIREGMCENAGEYTENGYKDSRFQDCRSMTSGYQTADPGRGGQAQPKKTNFWKVLCIILLCILLCPIIIPLGLAAVAVAAAVLIAILAVILGIGITGAAILIAGIATIILGIVRLVAFPAVGIALGGIGCVILAIGILICLLIVWCFGKVIPPLIRGLVSLIRYPFRKAGVCK